MNDAISSPRLAARVCGLAGSATVEMSERIRQAQAAGAEVLPLASGDPNLPTHPEIIAAAHRALQEGQTRYGPAAGLPALRTALARRLSARGGAGYSADELLVTPGGKFAVFAAMMAVVEPGDEVIHFDPCWVSYRACVRLCGGVPVAVPALGTIDAGRVAAAVTPRTRMIVVNSPVNPTGAVLSRDELAALLAIAERHDLWLLFDQVYAELVFAPDGFVPLQSLPGAKRRTFIADSLSKTYGMTGWRLGCLAAPEAAAKAVLKVIQHSIYCVPPFIQAAALAALALPESIVERHRERFRRRRDVAAAALGALPGISCAAPPATFYLFPKVGGDDKAVAAEWLEKLAIAVLPGSAFGAAGAGHLRLSLACSDEVLDEALARLRRHYLANSRDKDEIKTGSTA
ncbi:MAG TPA: aminotransferase class I/II-fold pyridoxal phosphate-dependent enzyme [Stellaceae bacterium]|nr:aminotransferase class I/II-fold pyridoxal phosphate-dependent enzyme [Stellaceae bacterium]